jgi:hypothetical protein
MSQREFNELVYKFDSIRHRYGVETIEHLRDLRVTNKAVFDILFPLYVILSYYRNNFVSITYFNSYRYI